MSNIVRTDPFKELARFDPFHEMEGFAPWPRLRRWLNELPSEPEIRLDLTEDDKAYHVKADLPGVKKEDIAVEIEGNRVTLSAEVKREKEEKKGEAVLHSERFYGKEYRTFELRQEIDRQKAQAKFTDGVLELTLPKSGAPTAKRITVQ
jgi:HSP20 family protein